MSLSSINTTLSDLGVTSLQILYDFSSYSGSYINSVDNGNTQYSGEVIGFDSSFSGQNSGSGYFTNQQINIQNTTGIEGNAFTLIFSQEKTGVGAGTIFSNLNTPSGFEVGISAANKLYYKNYINGTPNYQTFENYPSDKNLYAVSMTERGKGSLYRLNFGKKIPVPFPNQFPNANNAGNDAPADTPKPVYYNLEQSSFIVPSHTVVNGAEWTVGSGDYIYKGYMDYLLYFNNSLGTDVLRRIARAIHVDDEVVSPLTGTVEGIITGYVVTTTGNQKQIGSPSYKDGVNIQTGSYILPSGEPLTGAVGISGTVYVPQAELTGAPGSNLLDQTIYRSINNLSLSHSLTGGMAVSGLPNYYSSGSYWLFSGNSGTFNGDSAVGATNTIFGITGFSVSNVEVQLTGQSVDVFGMSGFSGSFYSGFSFSGLREPAMSFSASGNYVSGGNNVDESYFPNALSTMGAVDPAYFYELIYDISGAGSINVEAEDNRNTHYAKETAFMTGGSPLYRTNMAINGVSTFSGKVSYSTNQYNFPTATVISGFDISSAEIFTQLELASSDTVVYDTVESGVKNHLTITGLNEYSSAPFSEIPLGETQIFFNGVRLRSGVDYVNNGGFTPSGQITGATGVYFTYPAYSGGVSATGEGGNPITVYHNSITPNGYTLFFNGIREPVDRIIEHARRSDLITGTRRLQITGDVYNMVNGNPQLDL